MSERETTRKFTLALNKKIVEPDVLFKEVVRVALSISTTATPEQRENMRFIDFIDADGINHSDISALSLIIMRGTSGELRKFSESARERRLDYANVTRAIANGGADATAAKSSSEPEYIAVVAFGSKPEVEGVTGRLSLWR